MEMFLLLSVIMNVHSYTSNLLIN